MRQLLRAALQELGPERVRKAVPSLKTAGQHVVFDACFLCYALHGREACNSAEALQVSAFTSSLNLGWALSGAHFSGTPETIQMLRDEVMIFLAEHGDAPEPQIAAEVSCGAI